MSRRPRDERFDALPASVSLAVRRRQFDEHCAKKLAEVVEVDDQVQQDRFQSKLPGDERALRGIPAIGRGVAGAIPNTRPGDGLYERED